MKYTKAGLAAMSLVWLLFSFSVSAAQDVKPDDIVGIWLIAEDDEVVEKVEIYRCDDRYCGKIVWLKAQEGTETPVTDVKNKSEELRKRSLLGLGVLRDYEFDGENTWREGEFYAYRKGKTVSPKLTLIDENHLKIQVKILFVKKSFVWLREDAGDQSEGI